MLGYPWFVSGEVVHGDKRGRELGYPTANLRLDPTCGLRHGIYAVRVGVGGRRYDGVASFGRRPMFDVGTVLLEVFLFDFSGDLYGQTIDVAFIDWIRPEMKFDSIDDLVRRMDEDSRIARAALAQAPDAFPELGAPSAESPEMNGTDHIQSEPCSRRDGPDSAGQFQVWGTIADGTRSSAVRSGAANNIRQRVFQCHRCANSAVGC